MSDFEYKHTDIALSIINNDRENLVELLKNNGENNIYKEYGREQIFDFGENLLMKTCRLNKINCFEIILQEYEKDYAQAKKLIISEDDVKLLKYIFVAYNEQAEKVKELLIEQKEQELNVEKSSVIRQVFILLKHKISPEKNECVRLIVTNDNRKFLFELLLNGLMTINTMDINTGDIPGLFVIKEGRLDLLKRMINIGLNLNLMRIVPTIVDSQISKLILKETLAYCDNKEIVTFILDNTIFDYKIEELLFFTITNTNVEIFEIVLNFIIKKLLKENNVVEENKRNDDDDEDNDDDDDKRMEMIKDILDYNRTFFHEIINSNNHILLNYLIKYNFDYQLNDSNGLTPLHLAVANENNFPFIKEILKRGQDITIDINYGKSVLDNVIMCSGKEIIDEITYFIPNDLLTKQYAKCIELIIIGLEYEIDYLTEYAKQLDGTAVYDDEKNTAFFLSIIYPNEKLFDCLKGQENVLLGKNVHGETSLMLAIKYGTKNMIKYILENAPSLVNVTNAKLWTPLSFVLYRGDDEFVDIFDEIIKLGGDPFVIDITNNSLLHHAILLDKEIYVKHLLEIGLDPTLQDDRKSTPLHLSTKFGRTPNIFKLLLETGKCNIETKNYRGNTILHNVSKSYFPHFCEVLFELTKPDVMARNNSKQTALHLCFDVHRYRKFIENGAELCPLDDQNFPPYIFYAYNYCCDILMELFKRTDVDFTIKGNDNMTLLSCLPEYIKINDVIENERVKDMFRKSTNVMTYNNQIPVFSAVASRNTDRLKLMFELSETEIDRNHRDINNETALFQGFGNYYMFDDTFESVKFLLSKGYDVNAINNDGETVLFKTRSSKLMKILIENGGQGNLKNKQHETALFKACDLNNLEQIFLLLCYGGDLNTVEICTDEFTIDLINQIF